MSTINLRGFAGSNQAISPRLLPENVGVSVVDCEPGFGALRPMKVRTTVATVPSSPQRLSMTRMGRDTASSANYWLASPNVAHWTLGFGSDTTERTFYTGDGTPRWTNNSIALSGGPPYPQAYRELSVPAPTAAATVALNTDGTGTANTRFYVHTFVNDQGWESAPSPVSVGLVVKPGAIVDISALPAAPAGLYGITLRRIYRTQPEENNSNSDFFFLREIAIATTTTQDDARVLGDLIPTYAGVAGSSWLPPPADSIAISALWNSMFGLLSGKYLYLSEPGAPYAYPLRWRKGLKDTGVAIATWQENLLVLTTGRPVLFQGQDPGGMQDVPFPLSYACRSPRGVVSFEHGALWPSDAGLAYTGLRDLITLEIITPDQWAAMTPSSMVAGRWRRFYVCSFTGTAPDGSGAHAFMIDPLRPTEGVWYLTTAFDACYYDQLQEKLFVLEGANVKEFAAGPGTLTGSFKSKIFVQERPRNYSHARVIAAGYPLTLNVYSSKTLPGNTVQTLTETRSVGNDHVFKLAPGMAEEVQVKIDTAVSVAGGQLGTSSASMKGG